MSNAELVNLGLDAWKECYLSLEADAIAAWLLYTGVKPVVVWVSDELSSHPLFLADVALSNAIVEIGGSVYIKLLSLSEATIAKLLLDGLVREVPEAELTNKTSRAGLPTPGDRPALRRFLKKVPHGELPTAVDYILAANIQYETLLSLLHTTMDMVHE